MAKASDELMTQVSQVLGGEGASTEGESSKEVKEDDSGLENGEIRLKKMKGQRDDFKNKLEEATRMNAELAGKLDVYSQLGKKDVEPDVDPRDDMTDTEAALYDQIKQQREHMEKMANALNDVQRKGVVKDLQERENNFFKNNPDLTDRDAVIGDMKEFLETRSGMAKMLVQGEMSMQDVHNIMAAKGNTSNANPDPAKVFGNGKSEPMQGRMDYSSPDALEQAKSVLNSNDGDKKQAVNAGIDAISQNIMEIVQQQG